TRVHGESHDCIALGRGGARITVAGRDVETIAIGIKGWRRPPSCPGGRMEPGSDAILPDRLRRARDRISLPDLLACRRVERDHASTERAALVRRDDGGPL